MSEPPIAIASIIDLSGDGTYALATWLFLRMIGLIYLGAFASMHVQILGLIGSRGILPVVRSMPAGARHAPLRHFLRRPMLLYWDASDRALRAVTWMGMALAALVVLDVGTLPCLVGLWLLYLTLIQASGVFLGFQWDILLVEVGVLSILLAPFDVLPHWPGVHDPPAVARWMAVFLLARLVFSSGVVKLTSGCPAWRSWTAMCHHYETQPLPNAIAWYAHQLPKPVQKFSTLMTLVLEIGVPVGLFVPGVVAQISAIIIVGLMLLILLTGNYCFFNLLTIALCVLVFDDAALASLLGHAGWAVSLPAVQSAELPSQVLAWIALPVIGLLSWAAMHRLFHRGGRLPEPFGSMVDRLRPWLLVNSYGLFANMTTSRPEIILEGSADGKTWRAYSFRFKPGDLKGRPRWNVPHQPRADWQMWFAALGGIRGNPWLVNMMAMLLLRSQPVMRLLKDDPFAEVPARFIRATLYDYHFTTLNERRQTGCWWKRAKLGPYSPVLTRPPGTNRVEEYPYYLGGDG